MRDWRDRLENTGKVTKGIADKLALDQYDIYNKHRLKKQAEMENLADDEELKAIERRIEKKISFKR